MTEAALAGGRYLAMALPDPGFPRVRGRSVIQKRVCLGRINAFSETEDGRYLITLRGVIRFRVTEESEDAREVRWLRADYRDYALDLTPSSGAGAVDRDALLAVLAPYLEARGIPADWPAITRADLPGLVNTLCMICPFADLEKQALLEAPDLPARARLLQALMQMDLAGPPAGGIS